MILACPYCKSQLVPGFIYGDRTLLKWLPESEKLFFGIALGSEEIGNYGNDLSGRPRVKGYKCNKCNKIIIDLD